MTNQSEQLIMVRRHGSGKGAAVAPPASARRPGWDQDHAEHVMAAANGAQLLLQFYGDPAWRSAGPGPSGRTEHAAARGDVTTAAQELPDHVALTEAGERS